MAQTLTREGTIITTPVLPSATWKHVRPRCANVWTIIESKSKSIDRRSWNSLSITKSSSGIIATLGVRQIWHLDYGISCLRYPTHYNKYQLKNSHLKHLPVFWSDTSFLLESRDAWVTANGKDTNPVWMIFAWDRENACSGGDLITVFKVNPKATQIEFRSIKAGWLLLWNDLRGAGEKQDNKIFSVLSMLLPLRYLRKILWMPGLCSVIVFLWTICFFQCIQMY